MKYIDEIDIKNKKVILRCDYNVPVKDGVIEDNSRIVKSLKTINYLLDNNCTIIILSHFGRVKDELDKKDNSLRIVSDELSKLINQEVKFVDTPVGPKVMAECKKLVAKDIMLLENTRFCDIPSKLESTNDLGLASYWASLADCFVLDAFGASHREHSSVAGISKYIPTYYGLLIKEELVGLSPAVDNVKRPFGVFMGGAKVEDKLSYISSLLRKCDFLLLGGGIANSFLYAAGYDVGDSLKTDDKDTVDRLKALLGLHKGKIILPVDFVIDDNKILDLGDKTIERFGKYFDRCKTIFVNGSCGLFENEEFAKGTVDLFKYLENVDAYKIAGGGDTLNAISAYGLENSFDYLSSGGGAALEYVSTEHLKALDFIEENNFLQ